MKYVSDDELRDKNAPKPPSMNRIAMWVIISAIGLYFLVSGIIGIASGGS